MGIVHASGTTEAGASAGGRRSAAKQAQVGQSLGSCAPQVIDFSPVGLLPPWRRPLQAHVETMGTQGPEGSHACPTAAARPLARLARFAWELVSGDVTAAARSVNPVLSFSPTKLRRVVAEVVEGCGPFVHFGEITYATTSSHAAFRVVCSHSEWQLIVHATKDMNEPRFVFGILALPRGSYRHPSAFVPAITVPSDYMRVHGIPVEPQWWESDGAEPSLRLDTTVRVPLPATAWRNGGRGKAADACLLRPAAPAGSHASLSSTSSASHATWHSTTTHRAAHHRHAPAPPTTASPRARRVPFGLDGGVDDVCVDTIESVNPLARHASPAGLPLSTARAFRGSAFHVPLLEDSACADDRAATALALRQLAARSIEGGDPRTGSASPGLDKDKERGAPSPVSPRARSHDLPPPSSSRTQSVQGPPSLSSSAAVELTGKALPDSTLGRGSTARGTQTVTSGGQDAVLANAAAALSGHACLGRRGGDYGGMQPSTSDVVSGFTGEPVGPSDFVVTEAGRTGAQRPRAFGNAAHAGSWLEPRTPGTPELSEAGRDTDDSPDLAVPAVDSVSCTAPPSHRQAAAAAATAVARSGMDYSALRDLGEGAGADAYVPWVHPNAAGSRDAQEDLAAALRRGQSDELSVDTAHFYATAGPRSGESSRASVRMRGTPSGHEPGSDIGIRPASNGSTGPIPRVGGSDTGALVDGDDQSPGGRWDVTDPAVGALHLPSPATSPPLPIRARAAAAMRPGAGAATSDEFCTPVTDSRSRSFGPGQRWAQAGAPTGSGDHCPSPTSCQSVDTASRRLSTDEYGAADAGLPLLMAGEAAQTGASTSASTALPLEEESAYAVAHLCAESSFQLVDRVSVLSAEGGDECAVSGLRWWRFSNAGNVFLAVSVPRCPAESRPTALRVALSLRLHGGVVASQPCATTHQPPSRSARFPFARHLFRLGRAGSTASLSSPPETKATPSLPLGGKHTDAAPLLTLPVPELPRSPKSQAGGRSPTAGSGHAPWWLPTRRGAAPSPSPAQQHAYAQPFAEAEETEEGEGGEAAHGTRAPLLGMRGALDADSVAASRAVLSSPARPTREERPRARRGGGGRVAAPPTPTSMRGPGSLPSPYGAHITALSLERLEREGVFTEFPQAEWGALQELRGGDEADFPGLRVRATPWRPHRVDATAAGAVGEGAIHGALDDATPEGAAAPPPLADADYLRREAAGAGPDPAHTPQRGPDTEHGVVDTGEPQRRGFPPRLPRLFRRRHRTEAGGPGGAVSAWEGSPPDSSSASEAGLGGYDGSALGLIVPSLGQPCAQRRNAAPLGMRWTLRVASLPSASGHGRSTVVGVATCAPGVAANTLALGPDSFDVPDSHIDCLDCAMPPLGDGEGHPEWRAFARAVLSAGAGADRERVANTAVDTKAAQDMSASAGGMADSMSTSDTSHPAASSGWRSGDADSVATSVDARARGPSARRGLQRFSLRCWRWRRAGTRDAKEGFPSILRISSLRQHRVAPIPADARRRASADSPTPVDRCARVRAMADAGGEVNPCAALSVRLHALLPAEALLLLLDLVADSDSKAMAASAPTEALAATVAAQARRRGTIQVVQRVLAWCRAGAPSARYPTALHTSAPLDAVSTGGRRGPGTRSPVRRRGAARRVAPEAGASRPIGGSLSSAGSQVGTELRDRRPVEQVSAAEGQDSGIQDRVHRCAVRDLDEESGDGSDSEQEAGEEGNQASQWGGPAYTGLSPLLTRGEGELCALERATVVCALLQALAIPCRAVAMSCSRTFAEGLGPGEDLPAAAAPRRSESAATDASVPSPGPASPWVQPTAEDEDGITDAEPGADGGVSASARPVTGEAGGVPDAATTAWADSEWGVEVYCPSFGWLAFPLEGPSTQTVGELPAEALPFQAHAGLGADTLSRAESLVAESHGATHLPVALPLEGALAATRPPPGTAVRVVTARLPPLFYGRACPGSADGKTVSALAAEVEADVSQLKLLGLVNALRTLRRLLADARQRGGVTPSEAVGAILGSAAGSTDVGAQLAAHDAQAAKTYEALTS